MATRGVYDPKNPGKLHRSLRVLGIRPMIDVVDHVELGTAEDLSFSIIRTRSARDCPRIFSIARLR